MMMACYWKTALGNHLANALTPTKSVTFPESFWPIHDGDPVLGGVRSHRDKGLLAKLATRGHKA